MSTSLAVLSDDAVMKWVPSGDILMSLICFSWISLSSFTSPVCMRRAIP